MHTDLFAGHSWESDGDMVRTAYTLRAEDDDFGQPNALVNKVMDQAARDRLAETVASTLGTVRADIRERVFDYWRNVDKSVGDAIAELVNGPGVEPHGPAPANDDPTPRSTRPDAALGPVPAKVGANDNDTPTDVVVSAHFPGYFRARGEPGCRRGRTVPP